MKSVVKKSKTLEWIAVFGFLGYLVWSKKKQTGAFSGLPEGYKIHVDPSMAVDILTGPFELSPSVKLVLKQGVNGLVNRFSHYGLKNSKLKRSKKE